MTTVDELMAANAVQVFYSEHDIECLAKEIERGNPEILRNEKARELVSAYIRGEIKKPRGRPPKLRQQYHIESQLDFYHGLGLPMYDSTDSKDTAVSRVASDFNLSYDTILGIAKKRKFETPGFSIGRWAAQSE